MRGHAGGMAVVNSDGEGLAPADADTAAPRIPVIGALSNAIEHERPRWFVWVPVWFGSGIGGYFALAAEPSGMMAAALVIAAFALLLAIGRGTVAAALASALLAAALGFAGAKARTEWGRAPVLAQRINLAELRGFVELVEPKPQRGGRLTIRIVALGDLQPEARPKRVRIRTMGSISGFAPGDPVRFKATLSPPAAPALPGAYDFGRASWFQGLGAVGYSMARPERDETLGDPPLSLRLGWAIERIRAAIGGRIVAKLPGETGAIANALITGERGAISETTNAAFRDSGLFHALSISGLHMAVMAGAIFWTLRFVLACFGSVALRYPIKKWAAVGAAVGALFYLLISGSSPPTQRSYIMISIMFLAILLDRQALALRNIALSALLILAVFPESLLDLGFQMSYAAVGALVAAHEAFHRWRSARGGGHAGEERGPVWRAAAGTVTFFGGIAISTVIASLAVAPFGAYYFHKSQQYAILGNVLGSCDVYIMPLALATLMAMPFGLEGGPLWLMGLGIDLLVLCAKSVASLPGAVASVQAIPDLSFLGMVAGGIWLGLWGSRWRMLGLIPIAAGLAFAPFATKPDLLIGQDGKAIAVRLPTGNLSALPTKGRNFELARWLEYDGDSRLPADVSTGAGFRCDAVGCTATLNGSVIAVAHSAAAYADDCGTARILIVLSPRPDKCRGPIQVIDIRALRDQGTHTISLGKEGEVTVATVAAKRGSRPWSGSGLGSGLGSGSGRPLTQNATSRNTTTRVRLPSFAPPAMFNRNGPLPHAGEDDAQPLADAIPDVSDQ